MGAPNGWPRFLVGLVLSLALLLVAAHTMTVHGGGKADKKDTKKKDAKKKDAKKKDEHYLNLLKQLQARFNAWDLNNDNVLDNNELARAFRGPQAKPYDAEPAKKDVPKKPMPKKDAKDTPAARPKPKVGPSALALVMLPRAGLPVNLALAELLSQPPPSKPAEPKEQPKPQPKDTQPKVNPAVLQYGDFQFLALVSKNNDNKITKQEFDAWARGYAKLLDHHDDLERQVKEAKAHLAKAKTPQARKQAEAELARHVKELQQVSTQLNAISPQIHKALKVKN